jgi:hypothetical protein
VMSAPKRDGSRGVKKSEEDDAHEHSPVKDVMSPGWSDGTQLGRIACHAELSQVNLG